MNTDTINLVQQSFAQVRPEAAGAADLFYRRLFELDPDLRPLFTSDIGEQGARLMAMIGLAVDGLDDLDALTPAVQALGVRHRGYGTGATASGRSTTTRWAKPCCGRWDKGWATLSHRTSGRPGPRSTDCWPA